MSSSEPTITCPSCAGLAQPSTSLSAQIPLLKAKQAELQATLKLNRKNAQRQDASVRSEIDSLRKSLERQSGADHRARQKVLALQESVKRILSAAEQSANDAVDIRQNLRPIEEEQSKVKAEYVSVLKESEIIRKSTTDTVRANNMELATLQSELSSLDHKLERLTARREKLEKVQLQEVMAQLRSVRENIGVLEADIQSMIFPIPAHQRNPYFASLSPQFTTQKLSPPHVSNAATGCNPPYDFRTNKPQEQFAISPTNPPSQIISIPSIPNSTAPIGTGRSQKFLNPLSSPIGSGRRVGQDSPISDPSPRGPGVIGNKPMAPSLAAISTSSIWDF